MDSNNSLSDSQKKYLKTKKDYERMLADAKRNSDYSVLRYKARKANIESPKIYAIDRLYTKSLSKASINQNKIKPESSFYYTYSRNFNNEFTKSTKRINPLKRQDYKLRRNFLTINEEDEKKSPTKIDMTRLFSKLKRINPLYNRKIKDDFLN